MMKRASVTQRCSPGQVTARAGAPFIAVRLLYLLPFHPSVRPSFLLPFHTSPYRLPFLLDPILTNLISSTTQSVFFKRHATMEQPAVRFHVESFTESRWRVRVARGGDPSPACCSQAFKGTFFQGYLPDVVMSPAALFNGQLGGRSSFN